MVELFKWRTNRESSGKSGVIVGPDVGIVAMRTFIEMTADSFHTVVFM